MTRSTPTFLLGLLFACLTVGGCDSNKEGSGTEAEPQSRTSFESSKAPYSVKLPAGWSLLKPEELNPHADLAATKKNRLFLIVITQELPEVEGVDSPGVEAIREATMKRMRGNVKNLEVEQEGPVSLEKGSGKSVFLEGIIKGNRVQYIATFVTHAGWGYQIVAWGSAEAESELIEEVDSLIGGWQFEEADPQSEPSSDGDVQTGEASEQSDADTSL